MNLIYTKISILVSILLCISIHMHFKLWNSPEKVIRSDAASYYAYIPSFFIYNDLALKSDNNAYKNNFKIMGFVDNEDKYLIKTSTGVALMQLPFFMLGHSIALIFDLFEPTGYSAPYCLSLIIAGLFYYFAGLYLGGIVLNNYFSDFVSAVILFIITWSTNVSYYLLIEPGMSHLYSFFLFSVFLYSTSKWHRNQEMVHSICLGIILGLIVLVRPTNIVVVIFFLLWGVDSLSKLEKNFTKFFLNFQSLVLIVFLSFVVWIPQLVYWKLITNSWLYYSYGDERFFFLNPKISDVLFSFRKGWFVYTPIMLFAILGVPLLFFCHFSIFWGFLIFIILNIYLISSWWCWWYGGSFGQRPFVESYIIMGFPLAALMQYAIKQQKIGKVIFSVIVGFLLIHNMCQLIQIKNGALHMENMTRLAYFENFGRLHPTPKFHSLLEEPDFAKARIGIPENKW